MGHEIDKFYSKNQELICGICHNSLQNPLFIDLCDHIFCEECITQWVAEKGLFLLLLVFK
jgi:hypothetical protein